MFRELFSFLGRWGFLYIDLLLAAIFFWLSLSKRRRFYAWFGAAMLFQGTTQWLQVMERVRLAQYALLMFWTTIIVGIIVLIAEVREFTKYVRSRQQRLDEEGEND